MNLRDYLYDRGLRDYHRAYIDEENDIVTVILYNFMYKPVGFQVHNRSLPPCHGNSHWSLQRYWTYKPKKMEAIFGLESWDFSPEIYIVEGVFDAARLHSIGKTALAVLSNDPHNAKNSLSLIRRPMIALCDGDKAGLSLRRYADRFIQLPEGRDANDMGEEELRELLSP